MESFVVENHPVARDKEKKKGQIPWGALCIDITVSSIVPVLSSSFVDGNEDTNRR